MSYRRKSFLDGAGERLEQMFPSIDKPADCRRMRKVILADESMAAGEEMILGNVFRQGEVSMLMPIFIWRSRKAMAGMRPAGVLHARMLLDGNVPDEWMLHVLVFPGTVLSPIRNFYNCFCVPMLSFVGKAVRFSFACSYDLLSPDCRPVLVPAGSVIH